MVKETITEYLKRETSSHWSGGMIDLWYLEWQKQEKHVELFPIP